MNDVALFGAYIPGDSFAHRCPVGLKYALVLLPAIALLVAQNPILAIGFTFFYAALILAARLPLRAGLGLGWGLVAMVGLLAVYNVWFNSPASAAVVCGNILACLYASRLLIMTTPGPVLIDALVAAVRPLKVLGVDPERVGLAVAIMLRSIPYLVGSFRQVRTAARARGQERRLVGQVTPVVVDAVAYAQRTGEALVARGLGEEPEPRGRGSS